MPQLPAVPNLQYLGVQEYLLTWSAMQQFTRTRTAQTRDEIWLVEHPAVYTLGQASKIEHLRAPGTIPVIPTDRGGQVTYHAPGQAILYTLFDIKRYGWGVRQFVNILEQAVINSLQNYGIVGEIRPHAPGVYVNGQKIAFLGLRIRHGRVYHGLAFNVALDLAPFSRINPCGFPGLAITQLADLGGPDNSAQVAEQLARNLIQVITAS